MKQYILILLIFIPIFAFNITNASQCVAPTSPVCYDTVPIYQSTGGQLDGAIVFPDRRVILPGGGSPVQMPTKQVQISCAGTQKEIDYETQMLSYEVCSQTSNPSYDTSGNHIYCFAPSKIGCTTENDYGAMAISINRSGMGDQQNGLAECRNQINDYQTKMSTYNSCLSSRSSERSNNLNLNIPITTQITCSANSTKQSNGSCTCDSGYTMTIIGKQYQCITLKEDYDNKCKKEFGQNSITSPSGKIGYCSCNEGYAFGKISGIKQCITMTSYCTDTYGQNIHPLNNQCTCDTGYFYDDISKTCKLSKVSAVKKTPVITSVPAIKQTIILSKKQKIIPEKLLTFPSIKQTTEITSNSGLLTDNQDRINNMQLRFEANTTTQVSLKPVEKITWYQKIFNWLFK
ncbi:MAG: hypothetical protein NTZ87_02175 [Candidatus Nomurabacteria bacterium]|nr:hypothetical protein [Candidatus Nomurabacteria bacterium]